MVTGKPTSHPVPVTRIFVPRGPDVGEIVIEGAAGGALVGGWVISATGNVAAVYGGIGILTICIAAFFRFFTALGDAQRYVDERKTEEERLAADAEAVTA